MFFEFYKNGYFIKILTINKKFIDSILIKINDLFLKMRIFLFKKLHFM